MDKALDWESVDLGSSLGCVAILLGDLGEGTSPSCVSVSRSVKLGHKRWLRKDSFEDGAHILYGCSYFMMPQNGVAGDK